MSLGRDALGDALLERLRAATKIAPALGALVKVAPSKPAKPRGVGTSRRTESAILVASRTTSSVRSSEEPGGSWITVIR